MHTPEPKRGLFVEKESQYLLHILAAYLHETQPAADPGVDWGRLIALARSHNLVGILGYMADLYPICPDPQHTAALREFYLTTLMEFANRGVLAEEFSQTLADSGIDHILTKGFILREFFPVPELRTYGDVDLVIRAEDRAKSHDLMTALEFQTKTDWEPVYSYRRDSEYYELHTQLLETDVAGKTACRDYFRDVWDHAVPVGEHQFQLTPEYHFLYLLTHLAKHVEGSGAGVRMYLDFAALILRGEKLDWAEIARELEVLELQEFANVVLTVVQRAFGVPSPISLHPVPEAVLTEFTELTMTGGIFGRNALDSGTVTVRRESPGTARPAVIAKRLFPSAKTIRSRYTYLRDKPWLLPAAWIHRLIITRGTWKAHVDQAGQILSADTEQIDHLNRLYQEIGL